MADSSSLDSISGSVSTQSPNKRVRIFRDDISSILSKSEAGLGSKTYSMCCGAFGRERRGSFQNSKGLVKLSSLIIYVCIVSIGAATGTILVQLQPSEELVRAGTSNVV
ncbi:conserved hypothetical protein [Ricinus communis]|uniref:Uncharacterized protein n=1 Tax=Ricinus communis TaxID=3988 RepID=B9S7P9_RICCO|nr:conserved hypothetical protein [Ricinus communis]